ncbi:aspartyl protease family protein [Sphingobacterium sp. WOUb80]|uniref:aspartyl protease family protein n=1 Tax=Sphingobacterium sp. WOUb80 TaxID=3234028 RepID=UPI003CEE56F4
MKKSVYTLLALSVFGNYAFAQQNDNIKSIDRIIEAMNIKDAPAVLAMMADSATIGNLPRMNNAAAVPEILAKFSSIKTFRVVNQEMLVNGDEQIQLEVTYQDGKAGKPSFLFNRAGKIVNLGIIKGRMKGNPEKALADALANSKRPETLVIPFKLVNGLVYIESTLNGAKGYFQFDSGAPVVILRNKFVPGEQIRADVSVDFAGIGGQMRDVVWSTGNQLQMGGIVIHDLEAPVSEMDDMQLEDGSPIFGLLGIGLLKDYQFTLDYGRQELLLEKLDPQGELLAEAIDKGPLLAQYPLRLKRHIPIVDIAVGNKVYPMGIDCGANANVLKKSLETELKSYIDYEEGEVDIKGVNGTSQGNRIAYVLGGKVGKLALQDMYTVITSQAIGGGTGNEALPIDGLLGTPFLNQYKITLNFNKNTISFY